MYRYTQLVKGHCSLSSIFHKIRDLIISIIHQSFIFILFVFNFRWPFSSSFGRTMGRFWQRLHQRKLHKGSIFHLLFRSLKIHHYYAKYFLDYVHVKWISITPLLKFFLNFHKTLELVPVCVLCFNAMLMNIVSLIVIISLSS